MAEQEHDSKTLLSLFGFTGFTYDTRAARYDYEITNTLTPNGYGLVGNRPTRGNRFFPFAPTMLWHDHMTQTHVLTAHVVYVDVDGTVWTADAHMTFVGEMTRWDSMGRTSRASDSLRLREHASCDEFKATEKYLYGAVALQSDEELTDILRNINPYACKLCRDMGGHPLSFLMAPQLETLIKAGYVFADQFIGSHPGGRYSNYASWRSEIDCFNRLCRRGKSPAEIFKTSKAVYKVLGPYERSMQVWDVYRKLDKFGRISQTTLKDCYDHAMSVKNLDLINAILSQQYAGKPVFDWDSLYHYLCRLDKFEAIGNDEALLLLKDYLNMCRQLGMRPRTDGDSLKREHDVAARLCRNMRNDKLAQDMVPACAKLSRYDYQEGVYFIRAIKDFNDLLSEATQQHSCLVSYGQDIAKEKSRIFVLREMAHPERSLITVELAPDGRSIRQALTAYNKPIRNKSAHDFLNRWLAYVRDVDRSRAA